MQGHGTFDIWTRLSYGREPSLVVVKEAGHCFSIHCRSGVYLVDACRATDGMDVVLDGGSWNGTREAGSSQGR